MIRRRFRAPRPQVDLLAVANQLWHHLTDLDDQDGGVRQRHAAFRRDQGISRGDNDAFRDLALRAYYGDEATR